MPNLESHTLSSPPSLPIVPHSNVVKPIPNRALNLFTVKALNLNPVRKLRENEHGAGSLAVESEFTSNGDVGDGIGAKSNWGGSEMGPIKSLDDYVKDWVQRRVKAGISEHRCYLPFLSHGSKMVECRVCKNSIYPKEGIICSVRDCPEVYHLTCAVERLGFSSSKPFKCPQHECYLCKDKIRLLRCMRCHLASHIKCAAFPKHIIYYPNNPGQVLCWKHPDDWRSDLEQSTPSDSLEEIFCRLPLPYIEEEFMIDMSWKDAVENKLEPPPYIHIKRNVYLIKKRRENTVIDVGCTNCHSSECAEDCVCRVQCISCSKACKCSERCTNRPFRNEKKISIVQTALCGWGVVAAEPINKGEFIIEYVGEVIDDALCEQRLWEMKHKKIKNFYMCELRKDFTIDATKKGNPSRFLNHSCDPNCKLEKWQVEGETRVGVFAAKCIEAGEPLTYDYRFIQFGPEVKCHCGAPNCQGYLGTKRKISKVDFCWDWGLRRKRTATSCLNILKVD
ncbi:OLC1v1035276C1 [Oldenlandia corymbosa var. corymbosa]|uniref:OLC1v1035276C1 n=1 Tax=Oldenlandia corymbosa var. corymbosa TaxID=529605 RepID=A0AAV1CTB2_OLDCO|nr:OLC1v1035276C1 [Oldenlandia corymbosa var. corymbosa]